MPLGIRININGDMEQLEVDEIMDTIRLNRNDDEYRLIERYLFDDECIFLYGTTDAHLDFNRYEFQSTTPRGDVYVIKIIGNSVSENFEFNNLTIREFKRWYEETVDLTITDNEEEESYDSEHTSDRDFINDGSMDYESD